MRQHERTAIEQAAIHLDTVAQKVDDKAHFAPASEADINLVVAELPLSPELLVWYQRAAPVSDVYSRQAGNDLRIASINALLEAQLGYRWVQWPLAAPKRRDEHWPESWVVFADEGADPVIADTAKQGTPVLKDMHGIGRWDPWLLAPSLVSYLGAQARWIEICLIDSGFSASWERDPWDEEAHLTPDIEKQLRASLSTILPDDCIRYWLH